MSESIVPPNPGFLCIGAARAGTSWLHRNLKKHPQVWLPPLKELHYFDFQRRGAKDYYPIPNTNVWGMGWKWYLRHSAGLMKRLLTFRVRFRWAMHYIFGRRSDRWYQKLFRPDRLSGEITPSYMLMPEHVVRDVHAMNPAMKIIIFLRNPVSRAWSSVRKQLGPNVAETTDEQILKIAESPQIIMRSGYKPAIETWRKVFGESQVFVGFFDDLAAKPRDLQRSILQFLGVDPGDQHIPDDIDKVVNSGPKRDMPEHLLPRLYKPYLESLRELEQYIGGPVGNWRAKAEEAVGR